MLNITVKEFQREFIVLFNQYLQSFFPKDIRILDYSVQNTIVRLWTCCYTKDATMLVGQFAGLLTRNPTLCKLTNITSNKQEDLYLDVCKLIQDVFALE